MPKQKIKKVVAIYNFVRANSEFCLDVNSTLMYTEKDECMQANIRKKLLCENCQYYQLQLLESPSHLGVTKLQTLPFPPILSNARLSTPSNEVPIPFKFFLRISSRFFPWSETQCLIISRYYILSLCLYVLCSHLILKLLPVFNNYNIPL